MTGTVIAFPTDTAPYITAPLERRQRRSCSGDHPSGRSYREPSRPVNRRSKEPVAGKSHPTSAATTKPACICCVCCVLRACKFFFTGETHACNFRKRRSSHGARPDGRGRRHGRHGNRSGFPGLHAQVAYAPKASCESVPAAKVTCARPIRPMPISLPRRRPRRRAPSSAGNSSRRKLSAVSPSRWTTSAPASASSPSAASSRALAERSGDRHVRLHPQHHCRGDRGLRRSRRRRWFRHLRDVARQRDH
jgi:hypothetical protein